MGTLSVWIGAEIGSILAMLLGRYILRNIVKEKVKKFPIFLSLDKAIELEGLKLVTLLRLSPVIPFNFLNYFLGITGVTVKDYAIGGIGMFPGTIVYVYIGSTLSNISDVFGGGGDNKATLILLIVGTVLAFFSIVYISIKAKKIVNEILAK